MTYGGVLLLQLRRLFSKMNIDRTRLHGIYRYWIDWLYPNRCPCCSKFIDYNADFCDDCKENLTLFKVSYNIPCADGFAAYCEYDCNIKNAILHFKHSPNGNCYYAFASGIAEALRSKGIADASDIIVPIPISEQSAKKRGYNQSELIAKELRYMIGKPYANALVKIKDTKEQKSLGAAARADNVKGAFSVAESCADIISGKSILVIDDVCTTGSTLSEAARILKAGGAGKVYAAVFAKTPIPKREP